MGSSYLDGNELRTRALNWSGRPRRAQRGERPHRDAAREPGARGPPRLPARRQPPGARGGRAPARARDRARQGAARPPSVPCRRARRGGLRACTTSTITDLYQAAARAAGRARARLGDRPRGADRRRRLAGGADRGPAAASRSGRSASPGTPSGSARMAALATSSSPTSARRRAPSRASLARSRGSSTGMSKYVASIDQGTASSRCLVFDESARIVSVAQKEHRHVYPRPGWVEHDPKEIWENVSRSCARRSRAPTWSWRTSSRSASRTSARRRCSGTATAASR